ncbi:3358_t:CDS:1, partial [Paraglomus occultum]
TDDGSNDEEAGDIYSFISLHFRTTETSLLQRRRHGHTCMMAKLIEQRDKTIKLLSHMSASLKMQ